MASCVDATNRDDAWLYFNLFNELFMCIDQYLTLTFDIILYCISDLAE